MLTVLTTHRLGDPAMQSFGDQDVALDQRMKRLQGRCARADLVRQHRSAQIELFARSVQRLTMRSREMTGDGFRENHLPRTNSGISPGEQVLSRPALSFFRCGRAVALALRRAQSIRLGRDNAHTFSLIISSAVLLTARGRPAHLFRRLVVRAAKHVLAGAEARGRTCACRSAIGTVSVWAAGQILPETWRGIALPIQPFRSVNRPFTDATR